MCASKLVKMLLNPKSMENSESENPNSQKTLKTGIRKSETAGKPESEKIKKWSRKNQEFPEFFQKQKAIFKKPTYFGFYRFHKFRKFRNWFRILRIPWIPKTGKSLFRIFQIHTDFWGIEKTFEWKFVFCIFDFWDGLKRRKKVPFSGTRGPRYKINEPWRV